MPWRRTITGWITPEALIEAASSFKVLESKAFLGWFVLTAIWPTGISTRESCPSLGVEESRAPRPRPSPRLFMSQDLPREFEVRERAARLEVVEHHRPAVTRGLREAHVAGDDGIEDLTREVAVDLVADLEREARSAVEHRQHDALDLESRVQALAHELHGLEQVSEPLEGVKLALQRHEDPVGGHQSVDCQEAERRRAID